MEVFKGGARPTRRAPKEYFTGTVWQDPIIEAPEPARLRSSRVTFEPGARTAWHTHPFGQTLYVVAGAGRAQSWGGPVRGDSSGRRRLVRARREALARCRTDDHDGPCRHAGGEGRKIRRVAGVCERRGLRKAGRRLETLQDQQSASGAVEFLGRAYIYCIRLGRISSGRRVQFGGRMMNGLGTSHFGIRSLICWGGTSVAASDAGGCTIRRQVRDVEGDAEA